LGRLSQRIGRRWTTILAATLLLPIVPFWAFASSPFVLAGAAFLLQICVQGAWSVIPAHLNELSPRSMRATFPGFVYQLGNLLASYNGTLQSVISDHMGGNCSWALAGVASTVAIVIIILMLLGREARHVHMGAPPSDHGFTMCHTPCTPSPFASPGESRE
jgi:SHS family lactate transporter-like MFS transporter